MSQKSFRALGVSADVAQALAARDIHMPFPIQELVVPQALTGVDVLAKAPTGSGKTFAFGLPIVELADPAAPTPTALVLVPTRELASQVAEELYFVAKPKRLRVAAAYGGAPIASQSKRLRGAHIVVATPGRLQDLVERRLVKLDDVRILVLDEADRMLDMGFKPQVEKIVRRLPKERQTMLFSATLDGEVGELARAFTRNPARFSAERPEDADSGEVVDHRFVQVTSDGKVDALIAELEKERGLALVFVRTKRGADRLAGQALPPGRRRSRHARRHDPGRTRAGARALPLGEGDDARRNGRRGARPRPDGHHARHQLRPARGRQGLRPSRRPHRARRPRRQRHHPRAAGAAGRRQPRCGAARPRASSSSARACASPGRSSVYTSRRGRRSRW